MIFMGWTEIKTAPPAKPYLNNPCLEYTERPPNNLTLKYMTRLFLLFLIPIVLATGCSNNDNQESRIKNPPQKEEIQKSTFEENLKCVSNLEQTKKHAIETYGGTGIRVDFDTIFYSPKEDTCVYGIFVYKESTKIQQFILADALTLNWIFYTSSARFQDTDDPYNEASMVYGNKKRELKVNIVQ